MSGTAYFAGPPRAPTQRPFSRLFNNTVGNNISAQYWASGAGGTNPSGLDIPDSGTMAISAWVNMPSFPSGGSGVAAQIVGKGYDGTKTAYQLYVAGDGTLVWNAYNGGSGGVVGLTWTIAGWSIGTWHHIYADYDGSVWHVYFDGVLKATSGAVHGPWSTAQPFSIATIWSAGFPNQFVQGINASIYEVVVWNVALAAQEVAALASGLRPAYLTRPASVVGSFDTLTGRDTSRYANNLVLTGSPQPEQMPWQVQRSVNRRRSILYFPAPASTFRPRLIRWSA